MKKRILFSPIGTTDPITNYCDGSMLHICRLYKPDVVYLYLSAEMMQLHKMDNRYAYCIKKLSEQLGHEIQVEYIMRPELEDVQVYDVFYEDFRKIISQIQSEMSQEDELLLNIASGTPAMKSALLVLAVLAEYRYRPIQVTTPLRKSNRRDERVEDYDVAVQWELNEDNEPGFKNRCVEVKNSNFSALIKSESICKFVKSYDYAAALALAEEIRPWLSEKAYLLLEMANARLMLDAKGVDKKLGQLQVDILPIKAGNHRSSFEYALGLQVKLKRKEHADFVRALTPLTSELCERILKVQCKIDINDYCFVDRKGVRRFDRKKLAGTDVLDALNDEFKERRGGFQSGNFVSTAQVGPLIKRFSPDKDLAEKIDSIMKIEQEVRNLAAHDIVSVTDEWIQRRTGFTPDQIFSIIKYLTVKAGLKVKASYWESYERMNQMILAELKI